MSISIWNISPSPKMKEKYPDLKKVREPEKTEAFVNSLMMDRIDAIQEFDPKVSHQIMEDMHHSELARIFENADERDILTVCYVAVRKDPVKYLTVLMDYMLEKGEN